MGPGEAEWFCHLSTNVFLALATELATRDGNITDTVPVLTASRPVRHREGILCFSTLKCFFLHALIFLKSGISSHFCVYLMWWCFLLLVETI
jgi:hypothetical protein